MFSRYSVKKPYTVIVGVILVIVLGVISFQKMTTDLLPSMDLPYVVVFTSYVGATPEQVESEITRPMEAAFATLTDMKKITSSSRDNVSVVTMQFNDGANMDTALIEISSRLDQLRGGWGDEIGAPVTMKLNPDMLPVAILSVTRDDMDILALSDYVEDKLVPAFESLNGVASASASGVIQQRVDITIEQSRIDVLNSAILEDIDAELAEVERQLNDAQAQLSDGKNALARAKRQALKQIDDALAAIDQGSGQIAPAIEQLTAQRDQLIAQRDQAEAALQALESLMGMDDTQRGALLMMQQGLELLKDRLTALEAQLARGTDAGDADADALREQLIAQRDALANQLEQQRAYLSDLGLISPDALQKEIEQLTTGIKDNESALTDAQAELQRLQTQRDAAQAAIDELTRRIAKAEATAAPAESEAPAETEAPADGETTSSDTADAVPEGSADPADAAQEPSPVGEGAERSEAEEVSTPAEPTDKSSEEETTSSVSPDGEPASPEGEASGEPQEPSPSGEGGSAQALTDEVASPAETTNEAPANEETTSSVSPDGEPASPEGEASGDPADTTQEPSPEGKAEDPADATQKPSPVGEGAERSEAEEVSAPAETTAETTADELPSPAEPKLEALADDISSSAEPTASPDPADTSEPSPEPTPEPEGMARRPFGMAAMAEEDDVEAMRAQLDEARKNLARLAADIAEQSELVDALSAALDVDRDTLEKRLAELAALGEDEDVQSRSEEAQRVIDMLAGRIVKLDEELRKIDADNAPDALRQAIAVLREQISDIEASDAYQAMALLKDPDAMKAQYTQVKDGVAQLNDGIAQIDAALEKLNKGVIPGGFIDGIDEDTNLADARSALTAARAKAVSGFADAAAQISAGEAELNKARKEFNDKRDEALENAGLDGVITLQMVSGLIGAQNFAMPAGYVYDADSEQVLVRVGDKFDSLDALRRMKLFHLGLDSIQDVRLLDVASVELADDRDEVFTKLNGTDGILLSLEKQSTYSTADVAGTILARADALMAEDPSLHIVDLMNQGEYISIIVDSVLNNLISGGGLAILVLLLFLMDLRPTITVAFSIPISVVIAFVCMYFTGITLNVLSLSGLSLGIGMLVDNSIVAIENIYRLHDEEGVPLLRACVEGVRSVSGALFASTLTTVCVFLPIVFVQGMARDLFSDMGLSIAYSLLASLLVAMTVVPAMCSFLMRRSKPRRHLVFGVLQRFYTFLLRGALRVKPLVLLAALGLLAFAAMQVPKMGISFMPEVNSRQMSATLALDPEMPDAQQKDLAVAIMDDMMQVNGVDSVGLMGGSGGLLGGLAEGGGMSYYIMIDEGTDRRNADIAREMAEIGQRRGADLSVSASTMDISMLTGSGISAEITGSDIETLQRIALDVAELARQTEGVVDVSDGLEDAVPELRIQVDKEKAIDSGLTTAQVFQFIAQKVMGRVEITKVTLDGKDLSVYMRDGANSALRPADLENLEIEVDGETENKRVRVGDIAEVLETQSLSTIHRSSQRRLVTVSFGLAEGYSANLVSDAFAAKLKDYAVPAGYSVELAGENETVMKIMHDLVWMVLVAVLLIFLIMVAQFQSFKSPIIVMFTIPLAFTGGLLALIVTGMDLSIVSMLGFLVLSGVVVNNGIVFIDCVNQLRIGGMEKREALVETGRIRLRPILMTALTTILGVSTMALGRGMGAEMMQPMAVVSIGGLSYATLMTLFVVPVLYDLVNGKTMKAREIQMIKEAAGLNGSDVSEGEPAEPTPVAPAIPAPVAPQAEAPEEPPVPEPADSPAPAPDSPAITPDSFRYTPPPKAVRVKMGGRK